MQNSSKVLLSILWDFYFFLTQVCTPLTTVLLGIFVEEVVQSCQRPFKRNVSTEFQN